MDYPRFFDRAGKRITLEEWTALFSPDYQRVALTRFGDDVVVSTVWLGLDHHFPIGEPQTDCPVHTFETMVFGKVMDQEQWRYGTEADALDGHARVVEQVRLAYQLTLPDAVVARPVDVDTNPS